MKTDRIGRGVVLGLPLVAVLLALVVTVRVTAEQHAQGASPAQTFGRLVEGNDRFVRGEMQAVDLSAARRAHLDKGQQPAAVILSCADSRVAPEHLFNAGLGELFVVRVAGNIAHADAVASTEYALAHLGTKLVVVMGHSRCGAVAAAADAKDTPAVIGLVEQIKPAVAAAKDEAPAADALVDRAISINALLARKHLIDSSALIRSLVEKGEVKIVAARYELADGTVKWLETHGLPLSAGQAATADGD